MIIINLDKGFEPHGPSTVDFEDVSFPSGCEPHIKFKSRRIMPDCRITCRIRQAQDIIRLMLCVDAIRRMGAKRISLFIPYLPFARQDRVMVPGEPLSIKVFADMINSLNLEAVHVFDPHSEVGVGLINNCVVIDNSSFVRKVMDVYNDDHLIVSPDAGAYKKIFSLCQKIGYTKDIVTCNKVRDVSNGNIKSMQVLTEGIDIAGKTLCIVDDICDGGGTFIALAEKLRSLGAKEVHLIVSHGIFSKGFSVFKGLVDKIYTTDSFFIPDTGGYTHSQDKGSDIVNLTKLSTIIQS